MGFVDIHPQRDEVAVVNLPPGSVVRVHPPGAEKPWDLNLWSPLPDGGVEPPLIAVIPGDREHIGWGVTVCRYIDIRAVRNGQHKRDRAVWDQAVKTVKDGGVAYVQFGQQDWFGRTVWVAESVRANSVTSKIGQT